MVFAPPHSSELVSEVCANLGVSLCRAFVSHYADGECSIKVQDEVRGADCFVIQVMPREGHRTIDDMIMELLLLVAALRRASARTINVVLPYVPYARHMETVPDENESTPLAASDIAQMLQTMGADRVVAVDVHRGTFEGCFAPNVAVTNIDPQALAVRYFEGKQLVNPVIVSPDVISSDRAKVFWKRMRLHGMQCSLATMASDRKYQEQASRQNWRHPKDGEVNTERLVGDVAGCDCIIVDDMIDTGNRLMKTAHVLKKCGAKRVYMFATHGVMSSDVYNKIDSCPHVYQVVITNTIPQRHDQSCDKLRVLSVGGLLSETIRRIQLGESVTSLYDKSIIDSSLEPRLNNNNENDHIQ